MSLNMDIEDLSKTEIIMTALLVSFMTAIVTGIVVILLSEDPETPLTQLQRSTTSTDVSTTTSEQATTASEADAATTETEMTRDTILSSSANAIARVSVSDSPPQAGVLLTTNTQRLVVIPQGNNGGSAQALFEDGAVADLADGQASTNGRFTIYLVTETSTGLAPLSLTDQQVRVGQEMFVIPLATQPQISRVTITGVLDNQIQTSVSDLPSGSLLVAGDGSLVGLFSSDTSGFITMSYILAG